VPARAEDKLQQQESKLNMNTITHPGMIETVKDKSVAATEGTGHIVQKVVDTTAQVLTTTVKDTAKVGVGIETAAVGLVAGAVKGTEKLGVGAEHAVAAVAGGAIKAVGEVASTTVGAVHDVVIKPINSDKAAPKETAPAVARN
jgi:hypothetical protein